MVLSSIRFRACSLGDSEPSPFVVYLFPPNFSFPRHGDPLFVPPQWTEGPPNLWAQCQVTFFSPRWPLRPQTKVEIFRIDLATFSPLRKYAFNLPGLYMGSLRSGPWLYLLSFPSLRIITTFGRTSLFSVQMVADLSPNVTSNLLLDDPPSFGRSNLADDFFFPLPDW